MKSKDLKELKGKTIAELNAKEADFKKELFNLKMQHATGQGENPMMLKTLKRDIARVKTIISDKQKGA
ncbi:MAG: 50S ribosomal protein L29 [Proteobacteria bacterium]|nr:50S ribosomal protein L29 [Pseudomonadota bacterium]